MTLGLTFEKLIVIGFIAVMLIGPARLPAYAAALARTVRRTREFVRDQTDRMKDDLGPEITDVDWRSLDPRRYDPRRIVKEALFDEDPGSPPSGDLTPDEQAYVPRRIDRAAVIQDDPDSPTGDDRAPEERPYTPRRIDRSDLLAQVEASAPPGDDGPPGAAPLQRGMTQTVG